MDSLDHLDFIAYGICTLNAIPVRLRPEVKSEMVTQLLFGECFKVFDNKRKNWIKIQILSDQYIGWIDHKQCHLLDYQEMQSYSTNFAISLEINHLAFSNNHSINLGFGSHLPDFDGISFRFPGEKFSFSGQAITLQQISLTNEYIQRIARKFLYTPYMYGGKTCFGIDSSGFIQLIYKAFGKWIPRDSMDQVHFGSVVDFAEQSRVGDLAFFEDKEGQIEHVGMVMELGKIIHVYGWVRIDHFDHNGIYIKDRRSYTHKLRIIKRILKLEG